MSKKYIYEQGQRVYFNLDGKIKGWAKICGVATEDMPVIVRNWIIEPEPPTVFDNNFYPFSHITAFSCQLDLNEFEPGQNEWGKQHKPEETKTEESV